MENLNILTEILLNDKLSSQVKEFSAENCSNGSLAKVAKVHTNPCNFLACLPNPYKLSILATSFPGPFPWLGGGAVSAAPYIF